MDYPPSGPRNGDYSYRQNVDKYRRVIPPDHAGPDLQVNYDETWLRPGMRVKVTRRLLPHVDSLGDRPDPNFDRIGTVQEILPPYYGEQRGFGAYVKMDHWHVSFYPCHYFETELIPLEGEIGRLEDHSLSCFNPYIIIPIEHF